MQACGCALFMDKPKIFIAASTPADAEKARAALASAGFETDAAVRSSAAATAAAQPESQKPRDSAAFWKAIADYSGDAVFLVDAECGISFASPAIRLLTGREADEYAGTSLCAQVHPDDSGFLKKTVEVLLSSPDKRQNFEMRLANRVGSWRCIDVRAVNLRGIKPVDSLCLHLRDMTLQKALQRLIFNSAEKYRLISESLLSEIILVDGEGRILYMNEAASASMGGRPFVFSNRLLSEIFPDSRAKEYMDSVREVFASGKNKIRRFTVPVGHSRFQFLLDFQPVRGDGGKTASVLIINTDITGLETGEGENGFGTDVRRVFAANTWAFRAVSGRLLEADRGLANMLGYDSAEELAGAAPVFPESLMSEKAVLPSEPGGETFARTVLRARNGERIPALMRARLVRGPEGGLFTYGLIEDLRGRKIIWHNV